MRLSEPGRWDELSWSEYGIIAPKLWAQHKQAVFFRGSPLYIFFSRFTASLMNALLSQEVRRASRTGLLCTSTEISSPCNIEAEHEK